MGSASVITVPTWSMSADIQWAGLLRVLSLWVGVWVSKNTSLRFGLFSPNFFYWYERWIEYAVLLTIMPLLGLLSWTTWRAFNAIRTHAYT